jgi:hypothetical protein
VYCSCVNVYCHRVTTQLQLINILYTIWTAALKWSRGRSSTITEFGHPAGDTVWWHQSLLQRLTLATAAFRTDTELHTTGYHKLTWQNWLWRISPEQKLETQTFRITGCPFYRVTGHGTALSYIHRDILWPLRCSEKQWKGHNVAANTGTVAAVRSSPVTKTSSQTNLFLRSRITSY